MAQRSIIYKAELKVADLDRGYYADHALTIARHPSETEERLMIRVLAFALYAGERLAFGNGLSTSDEPDLWSRDLTGRIDLWIDVGLPDEKLVRRACGRAGQVIVISYGGARADIWWAQAAASLARSENLTVLGLPPEAGNGLARLAQRLMRLNCTVQERQVWLNSESASIVLEPVLLKAAG
jgi:uncharacterized protein YaeQ